ncbi:MAG: Maf family protein [Cellulosilyticaceae bacterium]
MKEKVILASGSPRRKELMKLIPVPFDVAVKEVDETLIEGLSAEENVMQLAKKKALAVAQSFKEQWVLGCDTVVICDGQILGKPRDEVHAKEMLGLLSGRAHEVVTGVCMVKQDEDKVELFFDRTIVYFKELSDREVSYYIETREPMDKAGAYGIQGYASIFISRIEGDYYNVMGLPIQLVYDYLKKNNLKM